MLALLLLLLYRPLEKLDLTAEQVCTDFKVQLLRLQKPFLSAALHNICLYRTGFSEISSIEQACVVVGGSVSRSGNLQRNLVTNLTNRPPQKHSCLCKQLVTRTCTFIFRHRPPDFYSCYDWKVFKCSHVRNVT